MVADRMGAQSKDGRDLGVSFVFGHPAEDFCFALGQSGFWLGGLIVESTERGD
jgi:hypothetical protein